ncbi:GNAT family N-acetyltransferase [Fulvivirga maritima]|uniref:GNAT family N-acetyltransferase n=1 Tax=Fulvivirga maritima TaxID=2904247 RepID=UPI001F462F85|nr:GNAT family N-acetyltransferase [Fulvivirga maritima]UII25632.1 GNAT family N-acetyltransferase [Fulvivirga maritima]
MSVRRVKPSDNTALANMIKAVFVEHDAPKEGTVYSDPTTNHLYELFQEDKAELWVAEVDGEVIGCCGIYPTSGLPQGCVELVKFYLAPNARGKGIGRALMEKSMESAQNMGYNQVYLESHPKFSKAVGMYEKLGFVMLQEAMGSSGHCGCNIWMLKELNESAN